MSPDTGDAISLIHEPRHGTPFNNQDTQGPGRLGHRPRQFGIVHMMITGKEQGAPNLFGKPRLKFADLVRCQPLHIQPQLCLPAESPLCRLIPLLIEEIQNAPLQILDIDPGEVP